ncbi:MAG: hypothetical protein R6V19_09370 [Armatimonadota bacterium]
MKKYNSGSIPRNWGHMQSSATEKEKPLSPGTKGCIGCSVIMVIGVIGLAYGARIGLQQAAEKDIFFSAPEPQLVNAPGGVLRTQPSSATGGYIFNLAWRDDACLTFTSIKMPGMSDIMALGQRGMFVSLRDHEKQREAVSEMASELFSQQFESYDFATNSAGQLSELAGQMMLSVTPHAWSPDGKRAVVEAWAMDLGAEKSDTDAVVYILDGQEGWKLLAQGEWPRWSADGKWIIFHRESNDNTPRLMRIAPDGTDEAVLFEGSFHEARQPASPDLSSYVYIWASSDDMSEGRRLVRINLGSTARYKMTIEPVGVKLGAIRDSEVLHVQASEENTDTQNIGLLDLATGHLRLIRRDVPKEAHVECVILQGRGVLVRKRLPKDLPDYDDLWADEPRRWLWQVLSCEDGKLREGPEKWQGPLVPSPSGNRIAGTTTSRGTYMGFVPMPMSAAAVWEIIHPDEVLSGPGK